MEMKEHGPEHNHSPDKRRKTAVAVAVEEQGERKSPEQPFERIQELVDVRSTFRIVTIDGGKTLNAELPIPRYVCVEWYK